MTPEITWSLIAGSYLFTAWVFRHFSKRIESIFSNHLHTIQQEFTAVGLRAGRAEDRLDSLEHSPPSASPQTLPHRPGPSDIG